MRLMDLVGQSLVILGLVGAVGWAATVSPAAQSPAAPMAMVTATQPATQPAATQPAPQVGVARLTYGQTPESVCFSEDFLTHVDRQTQANVKRQLAIVALTDDTIKQYPFAILTGSGELKLTDKEKAAIKDYLTRGGFLLASASCSDGPWAAAFTKLMAELFPEDKLTPLGMDHAVFDQLYKIEALAGRQRTDKAELFGLTLNKRLAVIFSPLGINDTAHAGGTCCCCGGNELRDATLINANVLIYALTH